MPHAGPVGGAVKLTAPSVLAGDESGDLRVEVGQQGGQANFGAGPFPVVGRVAIPRPSGERGKETGWDNG